MSETKMIGNKIAVARKKINLSQTQLADRLFISSQAVGKWERGESMPDITTFNRLAEILGVDLNYFSENFQSSVAETTVSRENQFAESPSERMEIKPGWNMSGGNWVDADFSGLKNLKEKFNASNMQRCKFIGSDLSGLILRGNNIESCDFSGSDIRNSRIQGSNLANTSFKDCMLQQTEFSKSHMSGCDFTGADFTGALFQSGGIEKSIIANAVWNRTTFADTYFGDIVFSGTLEDCAFENCGFKKVKFQNATLINTFFKNNKKLKQVQFIDCKMDKITYAFLKSNLANLKGVSLI